MNNEQLRNLATQTVDVKSDLIINRVLHNAEIGKRELVYPITNSIRFYAENIDAVLSRVIATFPEISIQVRTGYPSREKGYKISTAEVAATAEVMESLPLHLMPEIWLVFDWSDS